MTASSKERLYPPQVELPHKGTFAAASGAGPFYKGTLVVIDTAGIARVPTPGGTGDGYVAAGVATSTQTNVGSATGDATLGTSAIEVDYGVVPLKYQGTKPAAGQLVYVVDNQTCSITTGPTAARGGCGIVSEVRGSIVYVLVGPLVWSKFAAAGATAAATA